VQVVDVLQQRSDVRRLQAVFSENISIDLGDVTLVNLGANADVDTDAEVPLGPTNFNYEAGTYALTLSVQQFPRRRLL